MKILISLSKSAIDRYMGMFQCFKGIATDSEISAIYDFVRDHIMRFQKQDRITYFCKVYKCVLLKYFLDEKRISEDFVQNQYKKMKITHSLIDNDVSFAGDLYTIRKYLSFGIKNIDNYVFDAQQFDSLKDYFKMEKDLYDKKIESLHEYGSKIIEFQDGSAWFDLQTGVCKKEGKSMRHCGNITVYRSGDNILSYRKPVGSGKWQPLLTFVLDKDGVLGQRRGYANSKPNAKYHKVIVALLLNPIVRGIKECDEPEKNFSIDDLNKKDYESVRKKFNL